MLLDTLLKLYKIILRQQIIEDTGCTFLYNWKKIQVTQSEPWWF